MLFEKRFDALENPLEKRWGKWHYFLGTRRSKVFVSSDRCVPVPFLLKIRKMAKMLALFSVECYNARA